MSLVITSLAYTLVFLLVEWMYRKRNVPTEWARKLQHVACGLITACFPWLFTSIWEVVTLGAIMGAVLLLLKRFRLLTSLYSVERKSLGEVYFLLSPLLLFFLAAKEPAAYFFISLLTLAISDALAAIIGTTYQRVTYQVKNSLKSLEGSVIFFLSTFFLVHIPLLLMTDMGKEQTLLIALQIALTVTCIEALSLKGIDNLLIPLFTFYLLVKYADYSTDLLLTELGWQLLLLLPLQLFIWRFRIWKASGALTYQLFLYFSFILGGLFALIESVIALVAAFGTFYFLRKRSKRLQALTYDVSAVFSVVFFPTFLFIAYRLIGYHFPALLERWLGALFIFTLFLGAVSAHLGIIFYRLHLLYAQAKKHSTSMALLASLCSWTLIVPLALILQGNYENAFPFLLTLFICFFSQWLYLLRAYSKTFQYQALCVSISTIVALITGYFTYVH